MITNTGKEIIAKYLMGTTPAYASYIALGCGATPRPDISSFSGASSSSATVTVSSTSGIWIGGLIEKASGTGTLLANTLVTGILSSTQFTINQVPSVALSGATLTIRPNPDKQVLDFEMFRVPISSRGYVNDAGVNKIVFTAELPTEERYEISEVGIFSAGANSSAGEYDSKTLNTFSDIESWQYSDGATLSRPAVGSITFPIISSSLTTANIITATENAIQTNANNVAFLDATRAARYERCRYLNNIIMLRGDTSNISSTLGVFSVAGGAKFLQLSGQTVDFSRNSTSDLVKIAFSLINVDGGSVSVPDKVRVMVEFANSDGSQYARLNAEVTDDVYNFATNRYFVVSKRLDELVYNTGTAFSWDNVSVVKVYVSVLVGSTPNTDYFVALDAIRLDNISSLSPLYGMTGYSIIQNATATPIVKNSNSNNYIEFRMIVDVT